MWKYVWSESSTLPQECPSNSSHVINPLSVSVVDSISQQAVTIDNRNIPAGQQPVGDNYRLTTIAFDARANSTTFKDVKFPFPILALNGTLYTSEEMRGDILSVIAGEDTTIGIITSDVGAGETTFSVNSTVLKFISIGSYIRVTDEYNTTQYIFVVDIDPQRFTVTVEDPVLFDFSRGSLVQFAGIFGDNIEIGHVGPIVTGSKSLKTMYIPANVIIRIKYTNKSNFEKRVSVLLDYYY
jgi:hypothetical protein